MGIYETLGPAQNGLVTRQCEAPDHGADPHPAYVAFGYFVVVYPRRASWYFACRDHLDYIRGEIAMGKTQLRIMKWWGGTP